MPTQQPFVSPDDIASVLQQYSEQGIDEQREEWFLPNDVAGYQATVEWLCILSTQRYFTNAIQLPFSMNGTCGVIIALSTPESTRVCKENTALLEQGSYVLDPYWLYYQVWWYAGMSLLNFAGITDPRFQGQPCGLLG